MTGPLLATKLYAPRRRTGLVARPQLTARVRHGTRSRLTLVSAPAGFGKSTLIAEWLEDARSDGTATAWLSLDAGDNEPVVFWAHVISALRTAVPGIASGALALLESPEPAIDTALASLLNELTRMTDDIVIVLDDYHTIDDLDIQSRMAFVLDHLPAHVHLVIAARADPALPLARLRARGELTEVRAADLRFTADESAAYLNGVMGLGLTAPHVAALAGRTEGWIAALQLAGLSMQGRDDIASFIAGFAGDDRYIVDYLVEEVLQRQSEHVRTFLFRTSILARLSGSLCDAVTAQAGGKATLEALDRGNLFLIPLDDRRQWYRYHHLFADVLEAHLVDQHPDEIGELHRRAAAWYEANGERAEAIRHAMAGHHVALAADLVELASPEMRRARQETPLRRWMDDLPDEVIRSRPVLSNSYAGALLATGEVDGVEERLQDAERWLERMAAASGARPAGMVVVDEAAFKELPAAIVVHRAGLARIRGDVPGTMTHARRALELLGDNADTARGAAAALVGLSYWTEGDLEAALHWYAEGMASLERAGHLSDVIGGAIAPADIRIVQGRLTEALGIYQRALARATRSDGTLLRGAADMHVGISEILRQRDDVEGAVAHLQQARDLGDQNGFPQFPYRSRVAAALIRHVRRDPDGAIALLEEAERVYESDFHPPIRPIAAIRARVWIAEGRLLLAADWARERDLSPSDVLTYVREVEHITLARLLLAQGVRDRSGDLLTEAADLLGRLRTAAVDGGRHGSVIEILVLQALANQAREEIDAALASLAQAMELAEPEGYVRVFVDEGEPMVALLKQAAKQRNAPGYVRRLLAAVDTPGGPAPVNQPLIEPLSERELEVLRLLDSDLDGPELARELSLSLNTVRTHTKNIYAKLGVNSRRAAVSRAAELGLLPRSPGRRPVR